MTEGKTMAERMARVESWIEGHEERCEDRQRAMGREIGDLKRATSLEMSGLKNSFDKMTNGAWTVAGAVILQLCAVVAFFLAKALRLI